MAKKLNRPRSAPHPSPPTDPSAHGTAAPATSGDPSAMPESASAPEPVPATGTAADGIGSVSMAKLISVGILVLATVVIGALFFRVMASFFVPLFLAALLVVIFRPLYQRILDRTHGRTHLASILTTIFILLLVLLPATSVTFVAIAQGATFFRQMNSGGFYQSIDQIRSRLSLDLPQAEQFRQLDDDIEALADPASLETVAPTIEEVKDLAVYLSNHFRGEGADRDALDPFLEDIDKLGRLANALFVARMSDDVLQRQAAREAYDVQYWQVRSAERRWMQSVVGESIGAQLRLLANPSDADFRSMLAGAQEYLQPRVLPITQMAGKFLLQIFVDFAILVITLYFFFADGPSMIRTLMRLSPLDDEYVRQLLIQFDQTSRAVVLATVLSALAQGIMATVAYWFFGLTPLVFLFLATTFMAFIPFLGPAVVWVPVAIYLGAVQERWAAALGLAIFGLTVVSMIDNVVRMFVLQGSSHLHPLLALLSVLGGLQVFGPIGILVGPMVVVFLQTLLEILNHELQGRDRKEAVPLAVSD